MKAGIWFTICNVLQRGVQFITTPIFTRLLTTEQYGFYSLFITWMNILVVFSTLNITGGVYYNGLLKFNDNIANYTSALQCLCSSCTGAVFIIISLIYPLIGPIIDIPYIYIVLMFMVFVSQPALGFWSAQKRMEYKYKSVVLITLISSLLAPLLGIAIVLSTSLAGEGIVLGYVFVNIVINSFFYVDNLSKAKTHFSKKYWKYTLTLSLPLIPHYLSQIILGQSDRIMINYFCGSSKAGIYTLAYQVALVMNILISGINSAYTPWVYQKLKASNLADIKKNSSILIMLFMVLSMVVVLFAPEIILFLGTREYLQAIWIVPPVMLSTFITFIYCSFGTILFYYEETKKVAAASLVGAVTNMILNLIFIPRFGFIAAGYTTLASYMIMMVMYYIFMQICCKKHKMKSKLFNVKQILFMILILFGYTAFASWLYDKLFLRYMVALCIFGLAFIKYRSILFFVQGKYKKG